jgi:hypothetical protein
MNSDFQFLAENFPTSPETLHWEPAWLLLEGAITSGIRFVKRKMIFLDMT